MGIRVDLATPGVRFNGSDVLLGRDLIKQGGWRRRDFNCLCPFHLFIYFIQCARAGAASATHELHHFIYLFIFLRMFIADCFYVVCFALH